MARARVPHDAAVQHCLEYLGSSHPDYELEGSVRSVVHFEDILPAAPTCVAYAPINLDGQISFVVDVPPEVYELVRLVVHLARCLYAECGDGLRHPLRAHNHDHPYHLPQLLGGLLDNPGIVHIKLAPKQRRQDWLSGNCLPPPPRPLFLPQVHQSVHNVFVRLETPVGHAYNRREEDVEQKGREYAPLARPYSQANHPEHTLSSSRTHARMPSWN